MSDHPPSARRAILRRFKHGDHPVELLKEAMRIRDPVHASVPMVMLARDDRVPAAKAAEVVRDAAKRLQSIDRPGRVAEAWSDALAAAADLDRGPEMEAALQRLRKAAVTCICRLPNGEWLTDAIVAAAPHLGREGRQKLLDRGLKNRGGELVVAKAIVDLDAELLAFVKDNASPEVVSRLAVRAEGSDALDEALAAAWAIEDETERRETLRVLAWKLETDWELAKVAASSRAHAPFEQCLLWAVVAGRLDRLGLDATQAFGKAAEALQKVGGRDAIKAHRKLAQALERSGLEAPPAPEASNSSDRDEAIVDIPVHSLERHAFALVDGYSGGLGTPHIRAVARAAPLCIAFDLDLVLMGFPTDRMVELVDLVDAESNVGEGEGYARRLMEAERLHLIPLDGGVPKAWPGTPVATTPHPAEGKAITLDEVDGPLCLLVGQGKQGLPKRMLNVVPYHHELTGQGISMETATAMGILADRLGRLPAG